VTKFRPKKEEEEEEVNYSQLVSPSVSSLQSNVVMSNSQVAAVWAHQDSRFQQLLVLLALASQEYLLGAKNHRKATKFSFKRNMLHKFPFFKLKKSPNWNRKLLFI